MAANRAIFLSRDDKVAAATFIIYTASAMLNKKVLKDIQSLGLKKQREETGLFIAEGPKVVKELVLQAPQQVQAIYATSEWEALADTPSFPIETISRQELERISHLQTPNQVIAVLRQFESKEPVIKNEFCLYLDTIQDPGNFGTIIRIADWFGVKHIICSEGCADLYNPKVVQSTMASIARINVWYDRENNWLAKQSGTRIATTLKGDNILHHKKIKEGILMIGNESKGLRPEFLALATEQVTIPRVGNAESLNAAVATGIVLSHLLNGSE